jgi:hypothetical protein
MAVYDSLHSLLDHERLLFYCDEWRRITAHTLNCIAGRLPHESLTNIELTCPTLLNSQIHSFYNR